MARVKFIRDEEPNIRSLETNGGAIDGALYVATDTGNMWMGTDSNSLLKLSNPVIVEVDPYASKVTQEQYDTIAASWPNVILKAGQRFLRPAGSVVVESTTAFHFAAPSNKGFKNINLSFSNTFSGSIYPDLSAIFGSNTLSLANPSVSDGYGIMSADATTLECSTKGKISIKDNGVTTAKITDGAVTKAKLGNDIVIPTTKADIGLENVDNTADVNKSVKYATFAGNANTASVANSVAWDNVTGAPTIPNVSDYVKHEAINEYVTPDNKLNVELISGLDKYIEQKAPSPSIATTSKAGIVKPDGTTITVAADGTISGASTYTLPPASASSLGGVKVGDGLNVTDDGTLSAASTEEWSIVEVSIDATSITQEQYNTIAASWPNVIFKFDYKSGYSNEEVYLPSKRSLNTDFIFFRVDYTQKLDLKIPQVTVIIIHKNLSISSKITTNLSMATSSNNYGIMRADATTLECDDNGKISVKDGGITSTKLADSAVTKAKLGSDVPITYSSTAEPTASDGKNGDVWIVYEA